MPFALINAAVVGDFRNAAKCFGLFDHLVGDAEQLVRHIQSERSGGLEIDHQLELRGLLHRQIGGLEQTCSARLLSALCAKKSELIEHMIALRQFASLRRHRRHLPPHD